MGSDEPSTASDRPLMRNPPTRSSGREDPYANAGYGRPPPSALLLVRLVFKFKTLGPPCLREAILRAMVRVWGCLSLMAEDDYQPHLWVRDGRSLRGPKPNLISFMRGWHPRKQWRSTSSIYRFVFEGLFPYLFFLTKVHPLLSCSFFFPLFNHDFFSLLPVKFKASHPFRSTIARTVKSSGTVECNIE